MLYLATDHRGFKLKEELKKYFLEQGFEIEDVGAFAYNQDDDYVDFASTAAQKIVENPSMHKGIFICGSGHGMDMVANKFKGVKSALAFNEVVARQSREHEDANVLVFASDWIEPEKAEDLVTIWLGKSFGGAERNIRRLNKIKEIEESNFK